jgi:hypothetical protein
MDAFISRSHAKILTLARLQGRRESGQSFRIEAAPLPCIQFLQQEVPVAMTGNQARFSCPPEKTASLPGPPSHLTIHQRAPKANKSIMRSFKITLALEN